MKSLLEALTSDNVSGITSFLKTIRWQGNSIQKVEYAKNGNFHEWECTPRERQRLDHYVGSHDDRDSGEDDYDSEGWDNNSWEIEYVDPMISAVESKLKVRFPGMKFTFDVDEKGYLMVATPE